jgi:XTP/dITP diphosphohydrolase
MTLHTCEHLVLGTGNLHKCRELSMLLAPLGLPLSVLADFPSVIAVPEDGLTFAENARRKAAGYARQLGRWVLADDAGLEVDALAGAPGVCSARYAGEGATAAENRAKLLAELKGMSPAQRTARFVCHLAVAAPTGHIVAESLGACRGRIRERGAGDLGFGYDSLFEIVEYHCTLGECSPVATAAIGHRGRAVRALLRAWLKHAPSAL